ncbi:interferon-induced transmembrane protein 5-like [Neopelma chrysocephalum]|uniref:interferon-induced transmembrane protein 5-like n=1 Tax=Neopelma chrysocephalum TaxID=114329 RepID=UPI000FCD0968|nr:interferon-induced transmembrane protein 5-like [Neopelma chrysocephalum]
METRQADVSIPLQSSGWGSAPPGPRADPPPRDYVLWSLFNVVLWGAVAGLGCLGFPPLVYSIKARDCKLLGDLEGARRHSSRARVANIICSVLATLVLVGFIILVIILTVFLEIELENP